MDDEAERSGLRFHVARRAGRRRWLGRGCGDEFPDARPVRTGMDTRNLADLCELPALDRSSVTDRLDAGRCHPLDLLSSRAAAGRPGVRP